LKLLYPSRAELALVLLFGKERLAQVASTMLP